MRSVPNSCSIPSKDILFFLVGKSVIALRRTDTMNTPHTSAPRRTSVDLEDSGELLSYLRAHYLIDPWDVPSTRVLRGGVSSRTVLVEPSNRAAFVLKQALAKLRVAADWFSDPARIHREALGLRYLERILPKGAITPLLFEDREHNIIAMAAVPQPHRNWKDMLLMEPPVASHVIEFANILAAIHGRLGELSYEVANAFRDRSWFESLRLEPYYRHSAEQVPEASAFLEQLMDETQRTTLALVHGDYSPKNILIHENRLVLLDHEVMHFGDPAFDVGFSLTHLLSKAHHCRDRRDMFLSATKSYVKRVSGSRAA